MYTKVVYKIFEIYYEKKEEKEDDVPTTKRV